MAARAEYKFKPYKPVNLKPYSTDVTVDKKEKLLKSLEAQRNNLDERLRAEGIDPGTLGGEFDNRNIIEKALNLTPDQGPLMDFFEIINRPVEAIKGTIASGAEGKNPLVGFWEGISGKEEMTGTEFLGKLGIETPKEGIGAFVTNIAVDIALDPLTYLPAGFFTGKIGKLLSKTKNVAVKELAGQSLEILGKYGITDAAGNALKTEDDLVVALSKMTKGQQDEIITKLDEAAKLDTSTEIVALGADDDFIADSYKFDKNYKYNKTIKGYEARANWLRETQSKIEEINKQIAGGTLTPEAGKNQIADLLPKTFAGGKIDDNVLSELKMLDELNPIAKQLGPEYVAVMTTTASKADDVTLLRKVKIGDREFGIRVMSIDSKVATGAYGATATIRFAKDADGNVVDAFFSEGGFNYQGSEKEMINFFKDNNFKVKFEGEELNLFDVLKKFSQRRRVGAVGRNTAKLDINKVFTKKGKLYAGAKKKLLAFWEASGNKAADFDKLDTQQLGNLIEDYNSKVVVRNSFKPYELLEQTYGKGSAKYKEAKAKLDEIMKKMNRAKHEGGAGYIYLARPNTPGRSMFVKWADAEPYFDYSNLSFQIGTAGTSKVDQFRMFGFFGMDDTQIDELLKNTYSGNIPGPSQMLESAMTSTNKTLRVGFLDWLQDKEGLIGEIAKVSNKFLKSMKAKFALYGFLPDEVETAVRRMTGETAIAYQTRMRRLAALQDSFEKLFPGQSKTLAQLVEMGASLDDAGRLVLAPRTIALQEYFQHMLESADTGKPFQLRRFASEQAERRFLNVLEDVTGNQNNFKIVTKSNGTKVLTTNLDANELREALEIIKIDQRYSGMLLDFGRINPNLEQMKILKEWDGFNEFVTLKNDVQKLLVQEGGFTEFLGSNLSDTYLRHIMTKDAYEYLLKNQPGVLSKFAKPGSSVFAKRRYLGTIDEVNDYLKAIYDLPMDVIDTNVFRAAEDFFKYAFRNIEQGKMMNILLSSKDKYGRSLLRVVDNTQDVRKALGPDDIMFKSFNDEFNPLFKNLSEDAQKGLVDYLTNNGWTDKTKAIVMNRSMHSVLKRVQSAFVQLPDWLKTYDKYLNLWKGLTLVTPGFHMRNLFGNSFNSYAVGMGLVDQMRYARIAALEFDEYQKAIKILADGGTLTKAQQKVFDTMSEFQKSGLVQSHRGVRDLEQVKEATEEALKRKPGSKIVQGYNKAVRFNFNVAEKMDDMQRYMLWRWSFDKTGDAIKANKTVAKSLFDYSNLTAFEKDVMKRLFPFYTFMKNNFIFQAKNIFANPKQYARTGRAYEYYLEDIAGYSPEELPDYAVDNMWLPLPMMVTKNDKKGIAFLKSNLPITDFTELVENPFKKGVISVTVPIKLAIEIGAGRDMFTGAPLSEFPGQTNVMQEGSGVLAGLRDQRGTLAIAQTPLMQKILNDIGFRTPFNVASIGLDVADSLLGYQGGASGVSDFLQRTGVAGVQEIENIELTKLYQDLERLRELKKYYEQETGNQLPVLPRG